MRSSFCRTGYPELPCPPPDVLEACCLDRVLCLAVQLTTAHCTIAFSRAASDFSSIFSTNLFDAVNNVSRIILPISLSSSSSFFGGIFRPQLTQSTTLVVVEPDLTETQKLSS
jgi:hypothetical protein